MINKVAKTGPSNSLVLTHLEVVSFEELVEINPQ